LKLITTESFDVLITDLHMPNPSDVFAVITAMRHIHPKALTLLVSGYPDVKGAMDAILLEADEIIVKPFETRQLADLVHDKLLTRQPVVPTPKSRRNIKAVHEPDRRRLIGKGQEAQRTQPRFS
jgi:DNA-binding NtrC family response regulator